MVRDNLCDVKGLLDPQRGCDPQIENHCSRLCPRCVLLLRTKNVSHLNKYRCTYLDQKTKIQSLPPWKPEWDWYTASLLTGCLWTTTSVVPKLLLDVQAQAPPQTCSSWISTSSSPTAESRRVMRIREISKSLTSHFSKTQSRLREAIH